MSRVAIGVDMGGSHVLCGLLSEEGMIASRGFEVSHASLALVLPALEGQIRSLLQEHGASSVEGLALGICAVTDRAGTVTATNGKYDDGVGFDFTRWAEEQFGVRCVAENDARLALLGEHQAGAAMGFGDAVLVTLGTGIGGAVMLDSQLLRSAGGRAGGLAGHLGVNWRGRICSCGNRGCAEAEASTAVLDEMCRTRKGFAQSALRALQGPVRFRELFEAFDQGDRFAAEILEDCIGVWSALAVTLIHAYDPQVLVFGGGVMHRHETILPRIREHIARHAWSSDEIRVVPSALGSSAALHGAFSLLREKL